MIIFPTLNDKQVAVAMADGATGQVLNCKGVLHRKDSTENVYLTFDNIETARDFIKNQSLLNDKIEFYIYGENQTFIECIEATHWK